MIYCTNQIFGKVWKIKPSENGKYIDLQITTSEKEADGSYKNSGWFPRAIGHAANSLKGIKEGDRIIITKSKLTNERYEDAEGNKRSVFRFLILEASTVENQDSGKSTAEVKTPEKTELEQTDECPW